MKLLEEIAKDGKPLWKEIAVDTLKKAVATVVVESIKAGIDLMKRERIRHDDYAFQQWKKAREEDRKKAEKDSKKSTDGSDEKSVAKDEVEEPDREAEDPEESEESGADDSEEQEKERGEPEPDKKWLAQ